MTLFTQLMNSNDLQVATFQNYLKQLEGWAQDKKEEQEQKTK